MYYIHYYHPPSVINSDMVYDPEYMTGLYQREALSRRGNFNRDSASSLSGQSFPRLNRTNSRCV